ncbi:28S ribosomal protein S22, mitochondrial [Toxorhynchites rutilus septentrionalis]|uniref:28S ribosomal protein S22, mitochondrial n=1 Tax=Toxorhynchites rutilus septentrionalis TaxID=329112 RepID=UPI0024793043|nr:28S ribosomal protein S22, mitochondrial [Toxorhynchites rutilus septentrionalis]
MCFVIQNIKFLRLGTAETRPFRKMLKISASNRLLLEITKKTHTPKVIGRHCATSTGTETISCLRYEKDPGAIFMQQDVQTLLKSITRLDLDKVFKQRAVKNNTVEYKFMTDAQLRQEIMESIKRAEHLLQMPPVVDLMQDNPRVISKDGALKAFSDCKMVFTDITYGLKNSKRTIVERLPDGTLKDVSHEARKRLNQIYFPLKGRRINLPKMFETINLKKILDEGKYEFVLNRACIQFEPYEKEYHDITSTVYEHVNEHKAFDTLRSSRHFGPMSFFLAWHRLVDDLLLDMVKRDYLRNGVELILLYCSLHDVSVGPDFHEMKQHILSTKPSILENDDKSIEDLETDEKYLSFVEKFITEHSIKKVQLNLAIAAYREMAKERQLLQEGIRKMHGGR